MRLISIGSSAQAQIVLNSQYVSGYHAELLQLDNGDMMLVDKGSSNGTFVNGNRIAPEKEVTVTRNDTITIADQTLPWSMIPVLQIPDKENIRIIKGIGSHYLNAIHVSGNQVSRFHATVKQTKDGKWYICDHSTNGTTVNGVRLPKDQYVRFKKGDAIACAGVAILNPATGGSDGGGVMKTLGIALCACIVIGLCAFAAFKMTDTPIGKKSNEKIYEMYAPSTVILHTAYYFKITTPKYGTQRFVLKDGDLPFYNGNNAMHGLATGFFISENGVIVTNLHVTAPWLFGMDKDLLEAVKMMYHERHMSYALSDIKVEGAIEYIGAVPNGQFFDPTNATKLRVVMQSDKTDIDLAVLQTMNNKLPAGSTYVPVDNICTDNVPVGTKLFTMGFPIPAGLQDLDDFECNITKVLQATGAAGVITQNNDKYVYGFDATSYHGASGSPIFDESGRLVGVVAAGLPVQGYNFGVKAKYIKRLLESDQDN